MLGRKPHLTFSELVKLRSIQAAFGVGSDEEEAFWEKAKGSAKLRRAIKRGTAVHRQKRNKYQTYADAHRAASREYYRRNREKVLAYQKEHYRAKKEAQACKTGNR